MKQEGVIKENQDLAFRTVKKFYEENEYWPTQREAHVFLVEELDILDKQQRAAVITDGYRFLGRRMGELVQDPEDSNPDLLEKLDKREHKYLKENHPGADSGRKGEPHRIAVPVDDQPKDDSSTETEEEMEIPYRIEDGSEVRMGAPVEAIEQTDDLESVVEMLNTKDILDEYKEEVDAARTDSGESEDDLDDELVEKDGERYLFGPDEESDADEEEEASVEEEESANEEAEDKEDSASEEADNSEEEQDLSEEELKEQMKQKLDEEDLETDEDEENSEEEQQVLMKEGKVVV